MDRTAKHIYEFGPFHLIPGEQQLLRDNQLVPLTPKSFDLLVVLVENSGRLLEKEVLMQRVWPDSFVEEANLSVKMSELRRALGENPHEIQYIETVPRRGYRFVASVKESLDNGEVASDPAISQAGENGFGATKSDLSNEEPPSQIRSERFFAKTAAVGAMIGAIGFGGWLVMDRLKAAETPIPATSINSEAPTVRSPAYDLYVRGKVKVASENREDTEAAIKVLEEAVAIDPNFAEAYAQLARGYNTMAFKYSSDSERKRYYENAEVAIDKALALNPDLAEAHFARGLILWTNTRRFPHEHAIQSYKSSVALDPNLDETHHQLSLVYSHIGLLDEAEQSVKKALDLNPNNTLARFRAGVYISYQGRFDDAIAVFKTIQSDFTPLLVDRSTAEALIQTGRLIEAEAIVDDYLSRSPQDEGGSFTSVKALLLAKAGKQKEAEEAITRAVQIGKGFGHFHHTAYNAASAYAALNNPDEAVKWLEFAAENGFPNYTYFDNDPNLKNIRNHPPFIEFMTKLKLRWERFKSLV